MKKNKTTQRQKQSVAKKGLKRKARARKVHKIKVEKNLKTIQVRKEAEKKQEEELMKILNSREN